MFPVFIRMGQFFQDLIQLLCSLTYFFIQAWYSEQSALCWSEWSHSKTDVTWRGWSAGGYIRRNKWTFCTAMLVGENIWKNYTGITGENWVGGIWYVGVPINSYKDHLKKNEKLGLKCILFLISSIYFWTQLAFPPS